MPKRGSPPGVPEPSGAVPAGRLDGRGGQAAKERFAGRTGRHRVRLVPRDIRRKKIAGIGRSRYELRSEEQATFQFEGPADLDLAIGRPVLLAWRDGRLDWIEIDGTRRHLAEAAAKGVLPRPSRRLPWLVAWWLATAALLLFAWFLDRLGFPGG